MIKKNKNKTVRIAYNRLTFFTSTVLAISCGQAHEIAITMSTAKAITKMRRNALTSCLR